MRIKPQRELVSTRSCRLPLRGENIGMESLITGSTWLSVTGAVVGPFTALLIGFVGTDRLLRWQLAARTRAQPAEMRPK
jgi:hypothetical protein